MSKLYTNNNIIKYLYDECTVNESIIVKNALIDDPSLKKEFDDLSTVKNLLDGPIPAPSATSVKIVLDHAHNTSEHTELTH